MSDQQEVIAAFKGFDADRAGRELISAVRLRQLLGYDEHTGVFVWRAQKGRKNAGDIAGWRRGGDGYIQIGIDGNLYYAHQLAWLYMTGTFPVDQIDHRNGISDDNRFSNLRECTTAQNNQNLGIRKSNTSGATGVTWDKAREKWRAQIRINGKVTGLGRFETFEQAREAHREAKARAHTFQPMLRDK